MANRSTTVPEAVHRAAVSSFSRFHAVIAAARPAPRPPGTARAPAHPVDPDAGKSPEQRMVEKIRRRMRQYPEWYETDPVRLAASVAAELHRIGEVLARELPGATEPVEVWRVPLSVFNWLVEAPGGPGFVHGALKAWANAEAFNAANAPGLAAAERARRRAPFLDNAPVLLRAVLEEMLRAGLWLTFAEHFDGPELTALALRVEGAA